jgi:hypothetical protein
MAPKGQQGKAPDPAIKETKAGIQTEDGIFSINRSELVH